MNEKPEALRFEVWHGESEILRVTASGEIKWHKEAELRRLHDENEALTATRDRQAAMLRRLEDREAELDAEIGLLRRENERLRDELRQSSIDHTRAEVERLREALEKVADASMSMHLNAAHMATSLQGIAKAALRREDEK